MLLEKDEALRCCTEPIEKKERMAGTGLNTSDNGGRSRLRIAVGSSMASDLKKHCFPEVACVMLFAS